MAETLAETQQLVERMREQITILEEQSKRNQAAVAAAAEKIDAVQLNVVSSSREDPERSINAMKDQLAALKAVPPRRQRQEVANVKAQRLGRIHIHRQG